MSKNQKETVKNIEKPAKMSKNEGKNHTKLNRTGENIEKL